MEKIVFTIEPFFVDLMVAPTSATEAVAVAAPPAATTTTTS